MLFALSIAIAGSPPDPTQWGISVGPTWIHGVPDWETNERRSAHAMNVEGHMLAHGFDGISFGVGMGVGLSSHRFSYDTRLTISLQGRERNYLFARGSLGFGMEFHWRDGQNVRYVSREAIGAVGFGVRVAPKRTMEVSVQLIGRAPGNFKSTGTMPVNPVSPSGIGMRVGWVFGAGRPRPMLEVR